MTGTILYKSTYQNDLTTVSLTPVDYWRLTADGGLAFTDDGWLKTEDEQFYINSDGSRTPVSEGPIPGLTIGAEGIETGLLNILANSSDQKYETFGEEEQQAAHDMLDQAGFDSYLKGSADNLSSYWWNALTADGTFVNAGKQISAEQLATAGFEDVLDNYTSVPSTQTPGILGSIGQGLSNAGNWIGQQASSAGDWIGEQASGTWDWVTGLFGPEPEILNDQLADAMRVAGNPAETIQFWQNAMNLEIAAEYQDVDGNSPQCNRYVCDTIRNQFGQEVLDHIFPNGQQYANLMALELANNENVTRLDLNNADDLRHIQDLANEGYLILMAYQNPAWTVGTSPAFGGDLSGHLAFVAPESVNFFSLAFNMGEFATEVEGTSGTSINFGMHGPVMAQAGSYTGFTPMTLATNGWVNKFDDDSDLLDYINFYIVNGL